MADFRRIFAYDEPSMSPCVSLQKALGDYLGELRQRSGLKIEQLAEKSGLSSNRINAIERGEVNLNLGTMLVLAMSLETSLQDLFSGIAGRLSHTQESFGAYPRPKSLPFEIKTKQLWIGHVEVRPFPDCTVFDYSRGAFVHVVAWVTDVYEYGRKVAQVLGPLRLFAVTIENAEPLEKRRSREGTLEDWFEEIIIEAKGNPDAIICGPFYTYEKVDV